MNTHTLIIGAGVAGLASAWALHQRGHHVEILERGDIGQESSWAGAGILSLLLPWNYPAPLATLAEYSENRYPDWVAGIRNVTDIDPEYRRTGMLVRGLDETDLPQAIAPYGPGRWLPEVAQVRNPHLIQALADALRTQGVSIRERCGELRLQTHDSKVVVAVSGEQSWQADRYIVTAGAWSAQLLGPIAAGLPVRPVRGQMLLYKTEPERLPCIVYEGGKYLVPRADGHILAGATLEDVGFDKSTTAEAHADLHDFMRRILPDVASPGPIRHWAGLRPGSPENTPIVDRHPRFENLYVNTGHFRYGVTLAPACAELLADVVENKSGDPMHRFCAWPDILRAAPV